MSSLLITRRAVWRSRRGRVGTAASPAACSKRLTYRGFTGYDGVYADLIAWRDYNKPGNIAIRLPHILIGMDVDAYGDKPGAQTIADHEARLGALPATYSITSREPDGLSRIKFYRVPPGTHLVDKLPGGGVEVIQWRTAGLVPNWRGSRQL
jgi:hypothetical protein